ncbi:MAG: TonB-dependent siderophore receptor [Reyranella sp.]|uniref:TonB-dependent receptor n=1 Tax=Reyranella sp. TaxID=1929291 RepID=UPI0011FA70B5|nr:TonB-dependent receptor [Reyranella sp.]TAJ97473.1 MAG: TonB-dependent siderophore receptor [Reyranella sp.]TBR30182.1 MAG: TonB-dependent siderophore receptor [Reyranella sp.]
MRKSVAVMLTVVALAASSNAWAQVGQGDPAGPDLAQASGQQRTFDIPAQRLASALNAFGTQAGIQVSVEASVARGLQSQAVAGTMSIDAALRQLLGGTGIVARFTPGGGVMLSRAPDASGALQLDPVQVQGAIVPQQAMIDNLPAPYAGGQVATGGQLGLLGNREVMNTPFNQTTYTAKKAKDQQAKTIQEVLADDPSVRAMRPATSPGADGANIRGFPVNSTSWAFGGLFNIMPSLSPMAELMERVDILKGPSAMLSGMAPLGAIGGIVNVQPKRAPDEPLTQLTGNYISGSQFGAHADIGRRFGADKEFGARFNGVFRSGQTELQYNTDQRALASLGLDYRGDGFRLAADFGYQSQYLTGIAPYLSLAAGVQLPWAPSARSNPTAQPWGFQARTDIFTMVKAEVDLAPNVTAFASFGAHDNRVTGVYTPFTTITSFYGAATSGAPFNYSSWTNYLTAEGGVRADFDTGIINHEAAVIGTIYSQTDGFNTTTGSQPAFATNIYNPTLVGVPNIAVPSANKTSFAGLNSLAIADTLSAADKRVQLTVGARLQQVASVNYNVVSGATTSSYNETALSPSVALVVKPFWDNVSFYANWIQGLQQGSIVQAPFANAGTIFPPYKSTQYEAGVKIDWGTLTTTASIFQIAQPSILTNTTTNTQFLGGEQVNQGLELNVFGEVSPGFRILAGAMFINPVLAKTQGGVTDGWIAPFTPQVTLNLGGEVDVDFVRGLTLTGRAVYTGAQYIDATTFPRRMMPEWTRFDVGARYAFDNPGAPGKLLVARLNIDNVLDNNYWAGSNTSALFMFLGAPRTVRFSLTADF